nr:MAG TPA: hypothetical protein [Caudoviricetes sp.]
MQDKIVFGLYICHCSFLSVNTVYFLPEVECLP